ncbi:MULTISPECIES: hypothetical protein [Sphingobium]|nr:MULTISPECIES: hypothetical protein [Sphingobium]NML91111.1 hypothetical protein [Sphingobium sp. TB-6]
MTRTRERVVAMRPVTNAIARQTECERQARNFAFTQAKVARGGGTRLDQAILIGRTDHGYDWNEAVEFANGWYALCPAAHKAYYREVGIMRRKSAMHENYAVF